MAHGEGSTLDLTWTTASSAADRFEIQVRHRLEGEPWTPWQPIPDAPADALTASDSPTPATARRGYRIRACRANLCSVFTLSNVLPAAP